ncbi:unnamed protein product [Prunus armeniaca]|uniref:Uncharacterized protein n=1 Tax=Prunus armeniaca TaxID=36596 RepID=A0A6J5Y240_PRUAR|nr:unnamed protein product [Prunus armeniaca]CAB4320009.1 unnamed protein product [Prunus armeniaca]
MEIIEDALATGGEPNISDAFTINGQPGHLYSCSNVRKQWGEFLTGVDMKDDGNIPRK